MKTFFLTLLLTLSLSGSVVNVVSAGALEDYRKKQMIEDLELIKHHFSVGYAPLLWKQETAGYDLEAAFEKAKKQILETPRIGIKQYRNILRQFVSTTKDYHVDVLFYSTEEASLPFSVRGANGRYFIDWIDPLRLPPSYHPVRVGDELLQFDERPIAEVIKDLIAESGKKGNEKTDQRVAEIRLTHRAGMVGDAVPYGAILISTRSAASEKVDTYQLRWTYTPEHIFNPSDLLDSISFLSDFSREANKDNNAIIPQINMYNPLHEAYASELLDRSGGLGAKKSFLPPLGEIIWEEESESNTEGDQLSKWHAYIYRHPNGQDIGYLRIPHYHQLPTAADEFGAIINFLEESTDALVIDQLHNFGGYVNFVYDIASMLAIQPLEAPYHRIKITQKEVMTSYKTLEMIKIIDLLFRLNEMQGNGGDSKKGKDEDKEKQDGKKDDAENEEGDALNYQELMFIKAYHELILDEWYRGETLTRPTPILGVDHINPHAKYHYSKPILILIDEMDFSGGDFMPAILQDNRRALLFGSRTAGAGGFVTAFQFPNTNGIALCSYTGSIAERPGMQKIENIGITPDIAYELTASDIQNGYQGYIKAVNEAVLKLLD